jgi:hypothetical protein
MRQGTQAGELVLAALAQGEPVDAAAGELVEDLKVVSWESKTSSPGPDPVALFQ